jgi:hypothetical protein
MKIGNDEFADENCHSECNKNRTAEEGEEDSNEGRE